MPNCSELSDQELVYLNDAKYDRRATYFWRWWRREVGKAATEHGESITPLMARVLRNTYLYGYVEGRKNATPSLPT